jgi:hypothetical protein
VSRNYDKLRLTLQGEKYFQMSLRDRPLARNEDAVCLEIVTS